MGQQQWICSYHIQGVLWFVVAVLAIVLIVMVMLCFFSHRRLLRLLHDPRNRISEDGREPRATSLRPQGCIFARILHLLNSKIEKASAVLKKSDSPSFNNAQWLNPTNFPLTSQTRAQGLPARAECQDSNQHYEMKHAYSRPEMRRSLSLVIDAKLVEKVASQQNPNAISHKRHQMLSFEGKKSTMFSMSHHSDELFSLDWQIPYKEMRFVEKLAEGSFAEVYRGFWLGTEVAIKTLSPKILQNYLQQQQGALRRTATSGQDKALCCAKNHLEIFFGEIAIMATLHHPNVVLFYGACLDKPNFAIVMEFLPITLHNVLKSKRDEAIDLCIIHRWACDVARGMKYLHRRRKVMQRDLKSENVMIDPYLNAKICDFGMSRTFDPEARRMTFCGTPFWTAPEIIRKEPYQNKADVYSFGIVLWELATRQQPYHGLEPGFVAFAAANKGLRPVMPLESPPGFSCLIQRCWSNAPDMRPDFSQVLEELFELKKVHNVFRPTSETPKRLGELIAQIQPENY